MILKDWMVSWFVWRDQGTLLALAGQYASLAQSPLMLADIAARNGVFAPTPNGLTLYDAGIAEGRRRAAFEIFDMARCDPREFMTTVLKQGGEDGRGRNK